MAAAVSLSPQSQDGLPTAARFQPTILLTPPAIIFHTWSEIHQHFPDLDVRVFFATKNNFPDPAAKVISTRQLRALLASLDPADPQTGRIIILSSYPTFMARLAKKKEEPI